MENENNNVNEVVEQAADTEEVQELSTEEKKKAINLQDLIYVKKYIDDRASEEATARDNAIEAAVATEAMVRSNQIEAEEIARENAINAEAAAREEAVNELEELISNTMSTAEIELSNINQLIAKGADGWGFTDLANTNFTFRTTNNIMGTTNPILQANVTGQWYGTASNKYVIYITEKTNGSAINYPNNNFSEIYIYKVTVDSNPPIPSAVNALDFYSVTGNFTSDIVKKINSNTKNMYNYWIIIYNKTQPTYTHVYAHVDSDLSFNSTSDLSTAVDIIDQLIDSVNIFGTGGIPAYGIYNNTNIVTRINVIGESNTDVISITGYSSNGGGTFSFSVKDSNTYAIEVIKSITPCKVLIN